MKITQFRSAIGIVSLFIVIAVIWGVVGNFFFRNYVKPKGDIRFNNITNNLLVENVNETIDFYENTFGFSSVMTYPDSGKYDFAIIKRDSIQLMLQTKASFDDELDLFKDTNIGGTFMLYIEVNNLDSLYNVVNSNAEIVKELNETFYNTKEFAVKDNNGYVLIFAEDL